ncbi:MAG: polysaccharide biosynthesis protein [Deltaproteobacteria bacterium]|nr:MAG: polysaccharide biosynthesis protein [Deltaproteobacteria bacterium]
MYKSKCILVTGACGTIGRELVRQLLENYNAGEIIGIDNNESELFFLEQRFLPYNARFYLTDIRDFHKIHRIMKGIDVVFHAAAFKHVILCERSPFEAVQTNIMGINNLIVAASENQVEKFIFTSSDKAVNPTNVMGTSKLMGERIVTAANANERGSKAVLASTRFGNVLGSRGSVIPIFREQIRRGGPVTLTDPKMTRFIMSIQQAVGLVIDSAGLARGGEVFITKMPVIRIQDLAEVMIETLAPRYGYKAEDIEVKIIGVKPGEKMYEELMNTEETRRAIELEKYFVVVPAFTSIYRQVDYIYPEVVSKNVTNPYNSANEKPLSKEALKDFLITNHLLEQDISAMENPTERYFP